MTMNYMFKEIVLNGLCVRCMLLLAMWRMHGKYQATPFTPQYEDMCNDLNVRLRVLICSNHPEKLSNILRFCFFALHDCLKKKKKKKDLACAQQLPEEAWPGVRGQSNPTAPPGVVSERRNNACV